MCLWTSRRPSASTASAAWCLLLGATLLVRSDALRWVKAHLTISVGMLCAESCEAVEGCQIPLWNDIEIEAGGDLPLRRTSHFVCARSFRDVPDVHLLRWDYNSSDEDGEEVRRVLRGLRAGDSLTITATAPKHPTWLVHVVLLRVELYYAWM